MRVQRSGEAAGLHRFWGMNDRLTISVEGIDNLALVTAIDQTIRESFRELALPGSWRVMVNPSPVHGRWDFRVYGLDARHTMSIAVPPSLLSNLIPSRLRASLDRALGRTVPSDRQPARTA